MLYEKGVGCYDPGRVCFSHQTKRGCVGYTAYSLESEVEQGCTWLTTTSPSRVVYKNDHDGCKITPIYLKGFVYLILLAVAHTKNTADNNHS